MSQPWINKVIIIIIIIIMRTIESFEEYVDPIHEVIDDLLLPTLFGKTEPLPDELRELVTLLPAQGGWVYQI